MISKIALACLAVVLVQAGGHGGHGGTSHANNHLHSYGGHSGGHGGHGHDHYAYPKYDFEYGVKDDHTGDHKHQHEIRDGGLVKGHYEVDEGHKSFKKLHYHYDSHGKH